MDAGLLAYRELDHALGLTDLAGSILTEARHRLRSQAIDLRHAVTLSVNAQSCYRLRCSGGVIWEIPDKRRISK